MSRVEAGNSGFLCISEIDLRVYADLEQGSQASSCVKAQNSDCLSSCSWGVRPLVQLYLENESFPEDVSGVSVPLRVVTLSSRLHSKSCPGIMTYLEWTGKSVSFGMWHDPQGFLSIFNVKPASS